MSNTFEGNVSGLKRENFQKEINGKKTDLFILRNAYKNEVAITNYGGAIVSIMVPDKNGKLANVIQGHDNIDDVINSPEPYLSTLIGRFGNRICKGRFTIGGKEYQLAINNGPNALHGGPTGLHAQVWDAYMVGDQTLVLNIKLPYGHEGFTGEVKISVEFNWTDDNELVIEYLATTNKKTIINLTHHAFFSLQGIANPTPTIDDQILEMNADFFIPIDDTCIPTGEILKVNDTPFDFRMPKPIGKDIDAEDEQIKNGAGYDHCFVLNKREVGELSLAARLYEPVSGRILETYTTEPGVQVYSDNWATGYAGQHGATFPRRSGICFECQHFPDSPNRPYFPSTVLKPGEKYTQKTVYKFSVK
ncbi:MAG: galactose mutarotase [Bacteroidaceae bacterium]|jgi:aldose 1-epimerase|nr:galactose mutarotase [Bacteroidaceae bacterium]MBP5220495.1 galactose mutarotase [Bacteroidaceae bacterium]MBQ1677683.1 galactose mutarotase [Bacteroidaceae bacterium]MBQ2055484.1 galactose mutarotase [Bacteroidaceae bacterium]MBQ3772595.1 galactose mutarotase [Bacteroidaceae bacterium]